MEKKQTAVEWFFDKIKSYFEHDGELFETASFTYAVAKEKEKEQHGVTWDSAIDQNEKRGFNSIRTYDDFEQYYTETYGKETKRD